MCYEPPPDELVYMGDDGDEDFKTHSRTHENFPLGECQGDCDSDWDCAVSQFAKVGHEASFFFSPFFVFRQWGLKCKQRFLGDGNGEQGFGEEVPGCSFPPSGAT